MVDSNRGSADSNGGSAEHRLREPWRQSSESEKRSQPQPQPKSQLQGRATFHLPADLLNEMRNTVVALAGPPHRLTMSKLAENALRRELERLRGERGGTKGKPYSQRAGEVTRGRPIR